MITNKREWKGDRHLTVVSLQAVARCKMVLPSISGKFANFVTLSFSIKYRTASYWLFLTATWRTVSPLSVTISEDSRLIESISSMMLTRPLIAAQCKGVLPWWSCKEERSTSNFNSSLVISKWPLLHARCNGVDPFEVLFHANWGRTNNSSFTISAKKKKNISDMSGD